MGRYICHNSIPLNKATEFLRVASKIKDPKPIIYIQTKVVGGFPVFGNR